MEQSDEMKWSLFYGGNLIVSDLVEFDMNRLQAALNAIFDAGHGWLNVGVPTAAGLVEARIHVNSSTPVYFQPQVDNHDLMGTQEN